MATIQNSEALAVNDLRKDALAIAEEGYAAIDTGAVLARTLRIEEGGLHIGERVFPLAERRIYFVGVGKCAFAAAEAVEKLFGDRLTGGIAFDVSPVKKHLSRIEMYTGTHPLPSETNETTTKRIIEFLAGKTEDEIVLMLISGGGSTLLCLHDAPMTCLDESALFSELTERGAPIQDINIVRKHISHARGGWLAAAAYPAEVISLIVSDVPGNDIAFVASGPTILDSSTVADAKAILARYNLASSLTIELIETPKEEKYFRRASNNLFITNQDALLAMKNEAVRRGYETVIINDCLTGEARDLGRAIVKKLHASTPKTALLYAGESTVTLGARSGAGGRNQEMALAALEDIRDDELILPFASDGHDNTDHAGAIADGTTRAHAREQNLSIEEHLDAHRAYDFFTATGDALITGYTGSNVSDLIIALKK